MPELPREVLSYPADLNENGAFVKAKYSLSISTVDSASSLLNYAQLCDQNVKVYLLSTIYKYKLFMPTLFS